MPAVPLESRLLQALAPWREAGGWCVAFSGGLDSTVLLHLLAQLARSEALPALSALHVHHGLQAAADGWPAHCQAVCRSLGIPLRVERVQVAVGGSIEQAARDARYRAFQANLGEGQVLLTAQHLDDQAETLLFRLLRGAGLRGLAAMPASRPLGGGRLCRPLLGVGTHRDLVQQHQRARAIGLGVLERIADVPHVGRERGHRPGHEYKVERGRKGTRLRTLVCTGCNDVHRRTRQE